MTKELLDLFDEAKRIIDKQETLIKMQQSLINTMQSSTILGCSPIATGF